ncbi:MAG: UDP-N-acetylgalactosamine-undecaprenyl-phosphate N-acetylgalactosaminephosphotransferase [Microgenomates group bacterium ADurb.Bin219]|nr:MAG: UDP-N-acetylgalactosamine-undecaprenyl-phosphate N-acetylgalactosaminephosphotransferase [Microgenomates group bacterium ADurb.Bin219]HNP89528.1 sugar transferase [Candidatus Woesebacteria bacterium]
MYAILKRAIDIVGSLVGIIIFFPVCFLFSLAMQIESPGSVFADTPKRIGKDGRLFHLYKLRSMIPNAHRLLHEDKRFRKLLQEYKKSSYKLHEDPRVTRVGKFIRKHSIDELPQFINILKGEMSLVGPRPYYQDELAEQQEKYPETKPLVDEVLKIKPGLTGEWQVSGRSEVNFDKRIKMDADYAKRQSIIYDIIILLKSPLAMITGKGAV